MNDNISYTRIHCVYCNCPKIVLEERENPFCSRFKCTKCHKNIRYHPDDCKRRTTRDRDANVWMKIKHTKWNDSSLKWLRQKEKEKEKIDKARQEFHKQMISEEEITYTISNKDGVRLDSTENDREISPFMLPPTLSSPIKVEE
jgi:hypothetical protein